MQSRGTLVSGLYPGYLQRFGPTAVVVDGLAVVVVGMVDIGVWVDVLQTSI